MINTITSWNINGIRALWKKDGKSLFQQLNSDIICLQETKATTGQVFKTLDDLSGTYSIYANQSDERQGYSGTAVLTRHKPIAEQYDIGKKEHDQEGRVITLEYDKFFLTTVYAPNAGAELKRLDYRKTWDQDFLHFLQQLQKQKPVILCGDLNVAHQPIDLARPKANYNKSAGYTQDEIDGFERYLKTGWVDTFRHLHPETEQYTYWSYRFQARKKNRGWRLDYFLVPENMMNQVKSSEALANFLGSDHCPVQLTLA